MGFGQAAYLVRGDIARYDQDRVIGRIVQTIESQNILHIQRLHLVFPADDGHAIAMVQILHRAVLFAKQGAGAVFDTLVAFLKDHAALGQDIPFGQAEVFHPVCLHLHHQTQTIRGDALKIAGVIIAGKGVVAPAIGGHYA